MVARRDGEVTSDQRRGNYPALFDELFALRKAETPMTAISAAVTPNIIEALGNGDVVVAQSELLHVLKTMSLANKNVLAYTLSLLGEGNVQQRLDAAGEHLFCDARHVRRLGDDGIKIVAEVIGSADPSYKALAYVRLLSGESDAITIHLDVHAVLDPQFGSFELNREPWEPKVQRLEKASIEEVNHYQVEPVRLTMPDGIFVLTQSRVGTFRVAIDTELADYPIEVVTTPRGGLQVSFLVEDD